MPPGTGRRTQLRDLNLAWVEVSFDRLETAVFGFRYALGEVHQGDDREEAEEEECARPVDSAEQREERNGHDEVGPPVCDGGHAHGLAPDTGPPCLFRT